MLDFPFPVCMKHINDNDWPTDPPPDEDVRHVSEGLGGRLELKVELPAEGGEPDLHRHQGLRLRLPGAAHIAPGPCDLLVLELWDKN